MGLSYYLIQQSNAKNRKWLVHITAYRKPSDDEKRQQGMIKPSPASSFGERQRCQVVRIGTHRYRGMPLSVAVERSELSGKQSGNAEVNIHSSLHNIL